MNAEPNVVNPSDFGQLTWALGAFAAARFASTVP